MGLRFKRRFKALGGTIMGELRGMTLFWRQYQKNGLGRAGSPNGSLALLLALLLVILATFAVLNGR